MFAKRINHPVILMSKAIFDWVKCEQSGQWYHVECKENYGYPCLFCSKAFCTLVRTCHFLKKFLMSTVTFCHVYQSIYYIKTLTLGLLDAY